MQHRDTLVVSIHDIDDLSINGTPPKKLFMRDLIPAIFNWRILQDLLSKGRIEIAPDFSNFLLIIKPRHPNILIIITAPALLSASPAISTQAHHLSSALSQLTTLLTVNLIGATSRLRRWLEDAAQWDSISWVVPTRE